MIDDPWPAASARPSGWSEHDSQTFIDLGRYAVPDREAQIRIICSLVPAGDEPFRALDLCCGEGLLSEAILARYAHATVTGMDASPTMLARASARLARYGMRFHTIRFDLTARDWRDPGIHARAIVSSLAIHHLDDHGKRMLYRDLVAMLAPGGALIIADLVQPADARGVALAADEWDIAVRERAMMLDGCDDAFKQFEREQWNMYRYPDTDPEPYDTPSRLHDQLLWLGEAGLVGVDVYWMRAGHAIFGGIRPKSD
ncbi:MAG: class I SAM-dependent methyltransferase [Chloroflexi bacterium]|nr:class I SAM-dependent methyltransferase [Chloroflexota bacterium]